MSSIYFLRSWRTTASRKPLPVVVCGKNNRVSSAVAAALHPEYKVSHSIMSPEEGRVQLPTLLRESANPSAGEPASSDSESPVAIIVGGGYSQEDLDSMRAACLGLRTLPWLKVALRYQPSATPPTANYGVEIAQRAKECLGRIVEAGELDQDKVHII